MRNAATLRPTPKLTSVLGAQAKLMVRTHRTAAGVTALVLAVMIGLLARNAALGELSSPAALTLFLGRLWQPLTIVLFFWPLLVTWRGETPSRRGYHWSLPVRRPVHQLARLAAGWAWLVAAVAAGAGVGWIAGAVIAGGLAFGPPAVLGAALLSLTALYALGSVFALLSDHPLWWILGSWAGIGALAALAQSRGWTWLTGVVDAVLTTGAVSLSTASSAPELVAGAARLGLARPWEAALLWTGIGLTAMVAAAFVRQERSAGAA